MIYLLIGKLWNSHTLSEQVHHIFFLIGLAYRLTIIIRKFDAIVRSHNSVRPALNGKCTMSALCFTRNREENI